MQREYVLRRIAEALGREAGATGTAVKRDVVQRGEKHGEIVKGLESLPGLDVLGALSRPIDEAFERDVLRGAGALAVDITVEWAEEYWQPERDDDITDADLDTLEDMILTSFTVSGDEVPTDGYPNDVMDALREICGQVAVHHQSEPIGTSGVNRVFAVITALRQELMHTNN